MPLELAECAVCRKAFVRDERGGEVCPSCRAEAESVYGALRSLLRDHPDLRLSSQEAADLLGVEERLLRVLVGEGRLELRSGIPGGGVCPFCGAPLASGDLCDRCRRTLGEELRHRRGVP